MGLMQILYDLAGRPKTYVELLDAAPFDECVELNLATNYISNLFHIEGKYFVPVFDGSYKDMYRYCNDYMIHPEDRQIHVDLMDPDTLLERLSHSEVPGLLSAEFRYRMQNDDWRWVRQIVVGGEEQGLPANTVRFYIFDIQNRKERELGLVTGGKHRRAVAVDDLTGLMREREFFDRVRAALAADGCEGWCMIAVDVDKFKFFNDWYGREAGDFVLAKIGAYLQMRMSADGWIAGYLGQDDFCAFLPHSDEAVDKVYADIADIISSYGAAMGFMPVIGVCLVEEGSAVLDLLDRAKLALDSAKGDFKHPVRMFEQAMYRETEAEYRLLADFAQAIANREIYYVVQPQCRISTGKIVGVEALARWRKSSGEIVQPAEFIPVIEKYGFITDLDRFVWDDVCRHLRAWIDSGHEPVPVSVNVSRQDIYAMDLVEHFEQLTFQYKIPPSLLKIEITESTYADDTLKVKDTVRRLREKGFFVLMDDFGSGYSSLNMLDSLNVDVIKLDMRFLQVEGADTRKSVHIIESIINMAKSLELLVVTEGVETTEQAEFLHSLGCRYVQGFRFYRPMENADFEKLIANGEIIESQGMAFKPNDEFQVREFLDRNVYTDTMLNSMLGGVAFLLWEGDNVDVTRFNERFYEIVGALDFNEQFTSIQELLDARDRQRFFDTLEEAMKDEINGAAAVFRFWRTNGLPADFLLHFFYIGEEHGARKFYGSVRNMSQLTELLDEMKLHTQIANETFVFLGRHGADWHYSVGVNGLEKLTGISSAQFYEELSNGVFLSRIDEEAARTIRELTEEADEELENFQMPLTFETPAGQKIPMTMTRYRVDDPASRFTYVFVFKPV